ncbi:MAG: hypothetical protein ACI8S6_004951 [Myxococcota bacterium]|jgi:hypothetical protein
MIVLLLMTACSSLPDGEGIWLLQVPWLTADGCADELGHSFIDSYTPDEGRWAEAEDTDDSDALMFSQIEVVSDEAAVMVLSKTVWPGVPSGEGWAFSWLGEDSHTESREYEDGYRFLLEESRSIEATIQLKFDGDTVSGRWQTESTADTTWTESDEWEPSIGHDDPDGLPRRERLRPARRSLPAVRHRHARAVG